MKIVDFLERFFGKETLELLSFGVDIVDCIPVISEFMNCR